MEPTLVQVHVPAMACRHDVRRISACVRDLDGVVTVEVDLAARCLLAHGEVPLTAVQAAIEAAGYPVGG
jgi:copper chaperone CopZ